MDSRESRALTSDPVYPPDVPVDNGDYPEDQERPDREAIK